MPLTHYIIHFVISLVLITVNGRSFGAVYYVSPNGSDSNIGSFSKPWASFQYAANNALPGDSVVFRSGVYNGYVTINRSGQLGSPIVFCSYPNEKVIVDGASKKPSPGNPNIDDLLSIGGRYITIRGLEFRNAARNSIVIEYPANNVILDSLVVSNGYRYGIVIYQSSFNTVSNCTISNLYDYADSRTGGGGGNADGIAISAGDAVPLPDFGHNKIINNVVFNCSDDGIDTWTSRGNFLENNLVFNTGFTNPGNGFTGQTGLPAGNGNGFKLGGPANTGHNRIVNNVSYNNRISGFDGNGGQANIFYNNTAFNNPIGFRALQKDYNMINNLAASSSNAAYTSATGLPTVSQKNSWDININNPVFASTDSSNPDFLQLSKNSPAVDAGVNLSDKGVVRDKKGILRPQGQEFDLGAYEFESLTTGFKLQNKTPSFGIEKNPIQDKIRFLTNGNFTAYLINVKGQILRQLEIRDNLEYDLAELATGMYFIRATKSTEVIKLLVIR